MTGSKPTHTRKAFRKAGKIHAAGGVTASCVVMNVSDDGAMLFFERMPELPEQFGLQYGGAAPQTVRMIRREGKTVAVAFEVAGI
jgi:hypothetical protein